MTYQPSEIADLILLIALAPVILGTVRRVSVRWRAAAYVAYAFMAAAYVFTILEGFVYPDLFNLLEHWSLFGAGVSFVVLAIVASDIMTGGRDRS